MSGRRLLRLLLAVAFGALAAPALAGLVFETCRLDGVAHEARCATLLRPLDAAQPAGPQIEIRLALLPAVARQRRPDPVFFFAGGPGQSAIELAGHVAGLLARFGNRRDIVLVDQRGTGRSAPLTCDEGDALQELADIEAQLRRLRQCRDDLGARPPLRGVDDLRHFTTAAAADDVEAVRQALGAPPINLVGVSYGTRVALEVVRRHPHGVRRVVLDGVVPPDMALPRSYSTDAQAALDALLRWCAGDAACAARHPALAARWHDLLARLPVTVTLPHALDGSERTLRLSRAGLLGLVRLALYTPVYASALPWAIEQAAHGRWLPLLGLGQALGAGVRGPALAVGMHFAVVCAEDLPRLAASADAPGADFGDSLGMLYRRVCADWPRGNVPADFYTLVPSPVPVLLLSGGLDPVTPPRHGERVRAALGPQARHVVVEQAGHGVMALPCVREAVFRFVDAARDEAALAVDAQCAADVPRPPAWAPPRRAEAP